MSATTKLQFLKEQIEDRIEGTRSRETSYRRNAVLTAILGAGLSALTTVLIGADGVFKQPWLKVTSLVTSALVTFLTAYEGFMRNRHLWIQTNATRMQFYELRSDISYREAGDQTLTEEEVDKLFARYKEILDIANRSGETVRKREDAK